MINILKYQLYIVLSSICSQYLEISHCKLQTADNISISVADIKQNLIFFLYERNDKWFRNFGKYTDGQKMILFFIIIVFSPALRFACCYRLMISFIHLINIKNSYLIALVWEICFVFIVKAIIFILKETCNIRQLHNKGIFWCMLGGYSHFKNQVL